MATQPRKQLTWKRWWMTWGISWVIVAALVYILQWVMWPAEELQCRTHIRQLTQAVAVYNQANPATALKEDIPQKMIDDLGIKAKDASGKENHYYFLAPSPHGGVLVKCNTHEINPFSIELLGVTILSVIAAVLFVSLQGYSIFGAPKES